MVLPDSEAEMLQSLQVAFAVKINGLSLWYQNNGVP